MSLVFGREKAIIEKITTYSSPEEVGVTVVMNRTVPFEKVVSQTPPQITLRFRHTKLKQERYSRQTALPPLYRIDARQMRGKELFTEVVLYFTSLPDFRIEADYANQIRIYWTPLIRKHAPPFKGKTLAMLASTVSLNFKDADLVDILRLLAVQNHLNIVASKKVTGKITVSLTDVNLQHALDAILKVNGYDWFIQGNIVVVKPTDESLPGELDTRIYKLEYVNASAVAQALQNVITDKGKLQTFSPVQQGGFAVGGAVGGAAAGAVPAPTGGATGLLGGLAGAGGTQAAATTTAGAAAGAGGVGVGTISPPDHLLVTDVVQNFDRIEEVIRKLDQPIPQVNISVKFIETKLSLDERLGINWEARAEMTGPISKAMLDSSGLMEQLALGWLNKDLRIATLSLPAFRSLLEILSSDNNTRLIQEPQITTKDNTPAEVTVGTSYPVVIPGPTTIQGIQTTNFKEEKINITLNVTPKINEGHYISMDISAVVQALVGFAGPNSDRPVISERSTTTRVMVGDGETLLIGGLIFNQSTVTEAGFPYLRNVPILRKIFSHTVTKNEQRELLIFITPNIVRFE